MPAPPPENLHETPLAPSLGRLSALAIVVGAVIGSGIFIIPNTVADQTGGHLGLILGLWLACGLVSLCGALTLAELASMLPKAGGTYIYLREAYGRPVAFLWGWAEFWVIRSGGIAALAAGMMISLRFLVLDLTGVQLSRTSEACGAAVVILLLGIINGLGTHFGGLVQQVTTYFKVGFVALLAALPLLALAGEPVQQASWLPPAQAVEQSAFWLGIGGALFAIMWAYDGWGNLGVVAEDLHEPSRTIPVALIGGVIALTVLYTLVNLAYHLTWSATQIAGSGAPGVEVGAVLLGHLGLSSELGRAVMNGVARVAVSEKRSRP